MVIVGVVVSLCFIATGPKWSTAASASQAVTRCSFRQLEVAVAWGPGAEAGHVGIPFLIVNTGKSACTLRGYPTIEVVTEAINRTGYQVSHDVAYGVFASAKVEVVTLAPGATASFGLDYVDALNQKDTNGPSCTAQHVYVKLPVRNDPFGQLYETTVNFNLCYSGYAVSVTPIESGPQPKTH